MTKMRSFRFPEETLAQLKDLADRKHKGNQTQALIHAVDRYHQALKPVVLQGYIHIDRVGDLQEVERCLGCRQVAPDEAWIAIYSDGTLKGVLCDECVEAGRG